MKRYFYAVVSAVLAGIARVLLDRVFGYHHPYAAFYVAVLWSAGYGGLGPALVTIALGALAAIAFAIPPPFVDAQGFGTLSGFEFYFIVSVTGAILLDAQRRAERKSAVHAEIARNRLSALERETAERRRAEETAQDFEEQLRLTFEHAPVGICQLTRDGHIIEANPQFCEITGYVRQELPGADFFQIIDPGGQSGSAKRFRDLQAGKGGLDKSEHTLRRKDGDPVSAEVALSMVRGRNGEPRSGVAIVQDITNRKQAEEQIREAQKLESVGLLAGGIAHDFNNLLTGVLGNAALAIDTLPPDSDARRMLQAVMSAAKRAAELTAQLLAYAGKAAFASREVDLSALVRSAMHLIALSMPAEVEIQLNVRDHLPSLRADPAQLEQLFTSLVINAWEAIGEDRPGKIAVTTDLVRIDAGDVLTAPLVGELTSGSYVFLRVEDTGRGMDSATIKKIFDPFFTTKFMGRGLGLAAVAGIVRTHHGAVLVSSSPEQGSTFSVLLPVADSHAGCQPTRFRQYFQRNGLVPEIGAATENTFERHRFARALLH